MRRDNRLPGIIYGLGEESVKVQVDPAEIRAVVRSHEGSLPVLSLVGAKDAEKLTGNAVLVRELQIDPISHEYLHVDFLKIDVSKQVTVGVPIHFTGKAVGLKMGGIMDEPAKKLDITCFPTDIPEFIEVDTTNLDVGDSIRLKDIELPEGCSVDTTIDFTVVSVILPKQVVEVEEEAAEELVEGEEAKTKVEAEEEEVE